MVEECTLLTVQQTLTEVTGCSKIKNTNQYLKANFDAHQARTLPAAAWILDGDTASGSFCF